MTSIRKGPPTRATVYRPLLALQLAMLAGCRPDTTAPSHGDRPPVEDSMPASGLWTASGDPAAILRLAPGQLTASGGAIPATVITTPSAPRLAVAAIAFDQDGTLWVASRDDSLLLGFAPAALARPGERTASTVIRSAGRCLDNPTGLAFDAQHRLWAANNEAGTVVRFDRTQLTGDGVRTPAVCLAVPGTPTALAFDAAGSLWVSDHEFHTISRYAADQLEASGAPAGVHVLTGANGLAFPAGMAFDAAGNLWIANSGGPDILAFTPAQLAGGGDPAPHVVLSSREESLNLPVALAFDSAGNLWVAGGEGSLREFDRASLLQSGAPEPRIRLQLTGHNLLWSVAFWPKPPGLPLY